jgi:rod shape-determining protein MreD
MIFQTSLITFWDIFKNFYNLQTIFVVYLSLFRSRWEGFSGALFAGLLADSLSGGPWGLYTTTYLWMFAVIRWSMGYLHVKNVILVPFIIGGGVLFENFILAGTLAIIKNEFYFSPKIFHNIWIQFIWSLITGPFILFGFKSVQKKWELWTVSLISEKNR